MGPHSSIDTPLSAAHAPGGSRPAVGSAARRAPARHRSFILGRSDARLRSLVNQEERDRLHCLSMLVAGLASAAGLMLLLTAFP